MIRFHRALALLIALAWSSLLPAFPAQAQSDTPSLFVARYERGPNWRQDKPLTEQPGFAEHAVYVRALADEGGLLLGGPFADMQSGMTLLQADSINAARALIERDPLIARGAMRARVDRWIARAGNSAFLALLSAGVGSEAGPPWSRNDAPVLLTSRREGDSDIFLVHPATNEWTNLTPDSTSDNWPVWSPDGARIAFHSARNGKLDVWTMGADGSEQTRLTDHPDHDYLPAWSPDGRYIVFTSWRQESSDPERAPHLYIMRSDGSDARRLLAESLGGSGGAAWSPDGRSLVFDRKVDDQPADIFIAALNEGDPPSIASIRRLTNDSLYNGAPVFSPDGSRIAFYASEGETSSIVTMRRDGSGRKIVVREGQNWYPHWSPDGRWLIFTAATEAGAKDLAIYAVKSDGVDEPMLLINSSARDTEASWRPGQAQTAVSTAQPAPSAEPLVHTAVIDAPLKRVWRAFTTKEGVEAWMVPLAEIDLRKGGTLRTTYLPEQGLDGPGAIVHEFLDVEPMRRLSMRVVKCPDDFPWADLLKQTRSDIVFEPAGQGKTRVAITGYGYKRGGDWDRMRQFFDEGNEYEMNRLAALFNAEDVGAANDDATAASSDGKRVLRELRKFVGGEWIHEGEGPDGGVFRVRNVARLGPDGVAIISRGWLGDADGMYEHSANIAYLEPATGEARYLNVNETGAVAQGAITLLDDGTIRWAWIQVSQAGETTYQADMRFTSDDAYDFSVTLLDESGPQTLVEAEFRRVQRAPERFRILRERTQGQERSMGDVKMDTWTDGAVTVIAKRQSPTSRWSRFEVIVPASQREVWERFTTVEGMRAFFSQAANIDLRPGGAYEPLFFPDKPPGERGGEGVAFRDLDAPHGFTLSWNAPPQFPEVRSIGFRARLEFEPVDHATTRVRVTLDEFREGEQWDGAYDYFLKAWAVVLNRLRRSYTDGPIDWAREYATSGGG